MSSVLDELLERGYIKQFTHEDETRELLEKEKIIGSNLLPTYYLIPILAFCFALLSLSVQVLLNTMCSLVLSFESTQ